MTQTPKWRPSNEQRRGAAELVDRQLTLSGTQFRYTTSLAAGAIALSVNAIDKFGQPARVWLAVSWVWLFVVIISGVLELGRLPKIRNRILKAFREGSFDVTPGLLEIIRVEAHEQGFVWGFVFLALAGVAVLFPEFSGRLEQAWPFLFWGSVLGTAGTVVWKRFRGG